MVITSTSSPAATILAQRELDVVGLVVLDQKLSWGVAIVVNQVDTHVISRAEATIVDTRVVVLVDSALNKYLVGRAYIIIGAYVDPKVTVDTTLQPE